MVRLSQNCDQELSEVESYRRGNVAWMAMVETRKINKQETAGGGLEQEKLK